MTLSPRSQRLTRLRRLVGDRRYRDAKGLAVIEGPRQLRTAIDLGAELKEVFFRPDQNQILDSLKSLEIDFYEVDPQVLDDIADSASPQGVLAVARARETAIESIAEMHRVVVIDSVQDPGNLGAIVRTAAAAGFDAVVTGPGTADLWSTRAIRASAGTLFALHMAKRVDLESSLDLLRVAGHSVLATDVRGETSVYQVEIEKRMTLVVGSEAHGLSETIIDRTDAMIRVPMGPLVESLNVAVATGIVMYRMQEEGQDE